MEESVVTFSSKDTKKGKKLTLTKRKPSEEFTASSSESCRSNSRNTSRSGWRNFFNIFAKGSVEKLPQRRSTHARVTDSVKSVYLDEIEDDFAMAISMPNEIDGKDVQVMIELKAIGKSESSKEETSDGLLMTEETPSKSTFSGNVKIPYDTTIEQISKMPLYFINPVQTQKADGSFTNKIETVIKPLEDNLPENIDRNMIICSLNLRVDLKNTRKQKKINEKKSTTLSYSFLTNKKLSLVNLNKSEIVVHEVAVIEEVVHDESSNTIVMEILDQVVSKAQQCNDMSTQYSNLATSVNKEIDVQKSLLINDEDVDKRKRKYEPALKRIVGSEESLYPNSSSTTQDSSPMPSDSGSSMYYLRAPTNTPTVALPKYVIKYDNKVKAPDKKNQRHDDIYVKVLHSPKKDEGSFHAKTTQKSSFEKRRERCRLDEKNFRADIDKTLDLLECAKNQLMTYIDPKTYEEKKVCYRYERRIDQINDSEERMCHSSPPINMRMAKTRDKLDKKPEKKSNDQFFREAPKTEEIQDLTTPSKVDITMGPPITINTLQNIYDPATECKESHENLLQKRYSGNGSKVKNLTYTIVENDINVMIKDLLSASKDIKQLVVKSLKPQYTHEDGSPIKKKHECSVLKDVHAIIDILLDRTEEKAAENLAAFKEQDIPKVTQVNYCLVKEEPIKLTREMKVEAGEGIRNQPTVTVRRTQSMKTNMKNEEGLVERLEKDANFLAEIYHEVCSSESKIPNTPGFRENWKRVENILSQQVYGEKNLANRNNVESILDLSSKPSAVRSEDTAVGDLRKIIIKQADPVHIENALDCDPHSDTSISVNEECNENLDQTKEDVIASYNSGSQGVDETIPVKMTLDNIKVDEMITNLDNKCTNDTNTWTTKSHLLEIPCKLEVEMESDSDQDYDSMVMQDVIDYINEKPAKLPSMPKELPPFYQLTPMPSAELLVCNAEYLPAEKECKKSESELIIGTKIANKTELLNADSTDLLMDVYPQIDKIVHSKLLNKSHSISCFEVVNTREHPMNPKNMKEIRPCSNPQERSSSSKNHIYNEMKLRKSHQDDNAVHMPIKIPSIKEECNGALLTCLRARNPGTQPAAQNNGQPLEYRNTNTNLNNQIIPRQIQSSEVFVAGTSFISPTDSYKKLVLSVPNDIAEHLGNVEEHGSVVKYESKSIMKSSHDFMRIKRADIQSSQEFFVHNDDSGESEVEIANSVMKDSPDDKCSIKSYLKHTPRIGDDVIANAFPDDDKLLIATSEEVVLETLDLEVIRESVSAYSAVSRKSRIAPITPITTTSSSDNTVSTIIRHKPKMAHKTSASNKTTPLLSAVSTISSRLYGSSVCDSDYDADKDDYSLILPNLRQEYISMQELNDNNEIKYIEENVQANFHLDVHESVSDKFGKRKTVTLPESVESLVTSLSIESEDSNVETTRPIS